MREQFQRGSLCQAKSRRGLAWRGRFRISRSGNSGTRKEVSVTLGLITEMSEAEARRELDAIVGEVNRQGGYVRHFGIRGALKGIIRPSDTLASSRTKKAIGHIRGGIGAVSELLVCADLTAKGIDVFRAINPQGSCDLLCLVGEDHVRVEVKTAAKNSSTAAAYVDLIGQDGKFDILALVHQDGRIEYRPAVEISDARKIFLEDGQFPVYPQANLLENKESEQN